MEGESAKVLDSGRRLVVDMKRKRSASCMAHFTGAACSDVRDVPPEVYHKQIASHTDSYVYKNSSGPYVKSSLIRHYSNFMKSGPPQRILHYENEEWIDFSRGLVIFIRKDFQMKKAVVEVEFMGSPSLLDFLHMILVDLKTGLQQPIAWIDETGSCFFPEIYSGNDELHECPHSGGKENHPLPYSEPNNTHEIRLQLEIEVTTDGMLKMDTEGSNSHVKRLKVEGQPVNTVDLDQEASVDVKMDVKTVYEANEVIGENSPLELVLPKTPTCGTSDVKLDSDTVQLMFVKGMGPSIGTDIINGIQRISGHWAEARLELFEKQVEITKKYRGNANLRFAWLGSSKLAASRILLHGLGINELPKTDPTYGIGVHLTSLSHISASYCDVDENGVQHIVLCRVILGNMEVVHPGSKQCFPSCENYDSGVNDFLNPEHYTVWNMNMATHIYPEFVVSFRSPSAKGHAGESLSREGVSAVTYSSGCQEKLQAMSSPVDSVGNCHQTPDVAETSQGKNSAIKFAGRPPKSLWLPFPMLLGAIEDKVPYKKMKLVYQIYNLFKGKKISREELVRRTRGVVGDTLLRATIISLQAKQGRQEMEVLKQEEGSTYSP